MVFGIGDSSYGADAQRDADLNPDRVTDRIERNTPHGRTGCILSTPHSGPCNIPANEGEAPVEPKSFGTHYQEIRNALDNIQRSMHLLDIERKELHQERQRIDEKIDLRSEESERLARLRNHLQELKDSVEGVPVEAEYAHKAHENIARMGAAPTFANLTEQARLIEQKERGW